MEKTIKKVEVHLKGLKEGTIQLEVSESQTILTSGLEKGLELPHSCKQALCGKCAAKLLEGEVYMKANYALNEDELKECSVLLCQSLPMSECIVLAYT
ncbi:MAG: 2Fe-2S iron-sulfur cluster-binding protein [Owenweeksia sp.]